MKGDLNDLKLTHLTFDDIQCMTKRQFRKTVNEAAFHEGFEYLTKQKESLSKISHIQYNKLEIQGYLHSPEFTNKQSEYLCQARTKECWT